MRTVITISSMTGLAIAALLAAGSVSLAETMKFKADLSGKSEVPPNEAKGTGNAEMTYDSVSKQLSWTVNFSGLSGPATAAHFHGPAEAGKNAGVAVPIGTALASPAKGTATLTDAHAADLLAGRWYINVHTDANKPGEIRGQVTK
ncbi:MAG: CHRD domain-containing protein [Rhizobiales bacterium]|nr:CHRD domain-containing protein [Hyphomicrobiales bacterium]